MSERGTSWSITINNPTKEDMEKQLPVGWELEGQYEEGEEGTTHFQGLLKTPKTAFTTIKRYLPRAHIEKARNAVALKKYVHKQETRLAEFSQKHKIPTIFELQTQVAGGLGSAEGITEEFRSERKKLLESGDIDDKKKADAMDIDAYFMEKLDEHTATLIESGEIGIEFIAINPMWRSSWKRFWRSILKRTQDKNASRSDLEEQVGEEVQGSEEHGADAESDEGSDDGSEEASEADDFSASGDEV